MKDDDDFWDDKEKKYIEEDEESKRKFPSFLLICLFTTVGVVFALGLSLSAINLLNGNESINTIISSITGDDNKGKYLITYIENAVGEGEKGQSIIKDDFLHIINAKVLSSTNGGKGEVVYFGGLLLTTKNTFPNNKATITYEVTLRNDSSSEKTFEKIIFNEDGNVKYTLTGLNPGDKIAPGQEVTVNVTVEYTNPQIIKDSITIESSMDISYRKEDKAIHIIDAKFNGGRNGGSGEVVYYEGLFLTTKNTLQSGSSQVSYKVVIKNDSDVAEAFSGLVFNPGGDVKYTISGIENGDILEPGESVTLYILIEGNGDLDYPTVVESSTEIRYTTFTVVDNENGINLINQFPTPDEKGKQFEGKNYVYKFTLLVGKKTKGAYYELTAVENSDNTLNANYVKVYLEKNGVGVPLAFKSNGRVKVFTDYEKSIHEGAEGNVIYSDHINDEDINKGKIDFKLRMWVSEDVKLDESNIDNYNGKKFGIKVNTYAQFER